MAILDNLVSYWKLDETSGNASDSHGSNTLTNNNSVTYSSGVINNGADFESSSSQNLSITHASQTGLSITGDLSISFWVKFESLPSSSFVGFVAKKKSASPFDQGYSLYLNHDGSNYRLTFESANSNSQSSYHTWVTPATDVWYHIALTFTAAAHLPIFYINGVSKTLTSDGITNTSHGTTTDSFQVGSYTSSNFLDGMIDELGVWSRVLTADEITSIYSGISYPLTDQFVPQITFF